MSSPKSTGLMLLVVGAALELVTSLYSITIWSISFFVFFPSYYTYQWISMVFSGVAVVAAILILTGFILFRSEYTKLASQISTTTVRQPGMETQESPNRFCPNCGKQIVKDAKFCPFCGQDLEARKSGKSAKSNY